mgnify:FL=1
MIFTSPYKPIKLPQNESLPKFVLRSISDEADNTPILFPSIESRRSKPAPLTLKQVRQGAWGMATGLLSEDIVGRPWRKGEVMAFYSENQHDYLLAALGVMMTGAIPALLNPMYKPEELEHVFKLTKPRALLASLNSYENAKNAADSLAKLTGESIDLYVFDEEHEHSFYKRLVEPGIKARDAGDKLVENVQFDPAKQESMFCFSSGTSGLPKAVRLTHMNLIANTIQMTVTLGGRVNKPTYDLYGWYDQPAAPLQEGIDQVHYSLLPQFHCYGMITSIINLHTLTPAIIEAKFSPESFFRAVQKFRVTFAFVVPPILIALVRSPMADKYDLSSIKSLASGAAFLSKELCTMVNDRYGIRITDGTYPPILYTYIYVCASMTNKRFRLWND